MKVNGDGLGAISRRTSGLSRVSPRAGVSTALGARRFVWRFAQPRLSARGAACSPRRACLYRLARPDATPIAAANHEDPHARSFARHPGLDAQAGKSIPLGARYGAGARRHARAGRLGQDPGAVLSRPDDLADAWRCWRSGRCSARGSARRPSRSISLEGLVGLPVFAGAVAGPAYLVGPTGGYLAGFLVAAALVGFLADRGWTRGWLLALAAMTLGHIAIFALGFGWLAYGLHLGAAKSWAVGVAPFWAATIAKTLLAAALAPRGAPLQSDAERRLSGAAEPTTRPEPPTRAAFVRFVPVTSRWNDNDPYGHFNNVAYYAFFDAAVNGILVEAGLLDPVSSPTIAVVVENGCRFFASLSFPDPIEIGVAVERLGRSSARYRLAAFKAGAPLASAEAALHPCLRRARDRPADRNSRGASPPVGAAAGGLRRDRARPRPLM